jgi:hypothetical protein
LRGHRIGTGDRRAGDLDVAGYEGQSGSPRQELALAVPLDAGEADDLTGPDVQVDPLQRMIWRGCGRQGPVLRVRQLALLGKGALDRASDDEGEDLLLGDAAARTCRESARRAGS